MKVIGLWTLTVIICYALQTSLLPYINFDGFSANLLLLMTVSVAIERGHKVGTFFGFVVGLLQDLTSGSYFGLAIFSYMTIGLVFGKSSVNLFREKSLLPVVSSVPALALHFAITIFFLFLLGRRIDLIQFMKFDFWPAAIMQVILSYPVHRIVDALNEYTKQRR
ncbi:MAG: rod shape-determining protein MreD [Selenomonadaceae bacterium]|nr:rod shape-determining protein MreD [Selenomonadaceae bacterium]